MNRRFTLFYFPSAQYFTFSAGRTGQTFHVESDGLEHASHHTFGAVGGEYGIGGHVLPQGPEETFTPHFGLLFGGEGIEIHHVVE